LCFFEHVSIFKC